MSENQLNVLIQQKLITDAKQQMLGTLFLCSYNTWKCFYKYWLSLTIYWNIFEAQLQIHIESIILRHKTVVEPFPNIRHSGNNRKLFHIPYFDKRFYTCVNSIQKSIFRHHRGKIPREQTAFRQLGFAITSVSRWQKIFPRERCFYDVNTMQSSANCQHLYNEQEHNFSSGILNPLS